MSTVLSCIDVCKTYKVSDEGTISEIQALNNISFELEKGDRVGILGLNGSGKSTLIKIISGYIKPTTGKIILENTPVSLAHFDSLLHPDLSGKENVVLQLNLLGYEEKKIENALNEVIDFSELRNFINHPVKTYSSGMMLRLTFSLFKVINPKILLLDEVFSAGDVVFQRKVQEFMQHYIKYSDLIIMATHNISEVFEYCNKCMVLKSGKLAFIGSVKDSICYYNNETKVYQAEKFYEVIFDKENKKYSWNEKMVISITYDAFEDESIVPCIIIEKNQTLITVLSTEYNEVFIYKNNNINEKQRTVSFHIPEKVFMPGDYKINIKFGNIYDEKINLGRIESFEIYKENFPHEVNFPILLDAKIEIK